MLALAHALRRRPRPSRPAQVVASFGDEPFEIPADPAFPARRSSCSARRTRTRHRPELMVTFDAASTDRLGLLAGHAAAAPAS